MRKQFKVLILLGAQNDSSGRLSDMGLDRCDRAVTFLKDRNEYKVLLTGGFGWNFNRTSTPHSEHVRRYLILRGVPNSQILASVDSTNTVEDFQLANQVLEDVSARHVIVLTSQFHLKRSLYISKHLVAPDISVEFLTVRTKLGILRTALYKMNELYRLLQYKIFGFKILEK